MAKLSLFDRRRRRVRTALRARASGKPRLSVHRSGKHIYAQVIDDAAGKTLVSASTLDKDLKGKAGSTREGAAEVPARLAVDRGADHRQRGPAQALGQLDEARRLVREALVEGPPRRARVPDDVADLRPDESLLTDGRRQAREQPAPVVVAEIELEHAHKRDPIHTCPDRY